MMDVPVGNSLPDPYGGTGQPAYPWRGRITCHPAPGMAGSPGRNGCGSGAGRRMVRRANGAFAGSRCTTPTLAKEAGGVSGFILGSELVGLTRVRSASGRLSGGGAADGLLPATCGRFSARGTDLVYAADWTEYGAHVLDGGDEVRFPLDPLFAHCRRSTRSASTTTRRSRIGATGRIMPTSRWRAASTTWTTCAVASAAARLSTGIMPTRLRRRAQTRTPITDGAYGKPWVFRAERPRVLVVERACGTRRRRRDPAPTAWQAQSKPIWLTEIGVPAVDKGTNGPNVFPDPKSSESAYPPFSRGVRDDLMQARGAGGDPVALRSRAARLSAGLQSRLGRLRRAHGRSRQHVRLGLGCAAVSGLSGFRPRCGRTAATGKPGTGSPGGSRARRSTG